MGHENDAVIPMQFSGIKGRIFKIVIYAILVLICLIVLFPVMGVILTSFKSLADVGNGSPLSLPSSLYLDNYKKVIEKGHLLIGLKNSLILVLVTSVLNILISSSAAYCLNRFEFKFKKPIMMLFMLGMMVPAYTTELSRFSVIKNLGLYNTLGAPILIYCAADLLQIYVYKQFLEKIPVSLDESAMIDGANYMTVFTKIIFPLLKPASATLIIIKAVTVINDMYIPYLYMPSTKNATLTTTLMTFNSAQTGTWNVLSAMIVIILVPTIIVYIMLQKYIFAGITAGAIKE